MRLWELFLDYLFPPRPIHFLSTEDFLALPHAVETGSDTIVLFEYAHRRVKDLVWEVKYKGDTVLAGKLGVLLYDALTAEMAERNVVEAFGTPVVVPVPSSNKRRVEKGFNQAELLARALVKNAPEQFEYRPNVLEKVRHTESQLTTESRSERLENLKGSMEARDRGAVAGRLVVVVDDVTTTGATCAEARRALRMQGAAKVLCIAVAH